MNWHSIKTNVISIDQEVNNLAVWGSIHCVHVDTVKLYFPGNNI